MKICFTCSFLLSSAACKRAILVAASLSKRVWSAAAGARSSPANANEATSGRFGVGYARCAFVCNITGKFSVVSSNQISVVQASGYGLLVTAHYKNDLSALATSSQRSLLLLRLAFGKSVRLYLVNVAVKSLLAGRLELLLR